MEAPTPSRCPRCRGRLVIEADSISTHVNCLMCGYVHEPARLDLALAYAETASPEGGLRR